MLNKIKNILKNREDSEHQQCLVRFIMGSFWLVYVLWLNSNNLQHPAVIASALVFLFAPPLTFLWIIFAPKTMPIRRLCSMLCDIGLVSYAFIYLGEAGVPIFGAYLFITFGYGFRYGNKYLFISAAFSIIGFYFVLKHSTYWHTNAYLSTGVIISIVMLSGYVSILISQLHKAVKEAKAANEAKSQFLANMSHEIRTPLNGVIGMSKLLSIAKLPPKEKDFASTINASAQNLLTLINDILDISKIEAGKLEVETINFDLHALVNSTAMMLSPQAKNKGVSFHVHISPEIPFLLRGDKLHVRQVIINLISNAIKFTNEGLIEVYVKPVTSDSNNIRVRFEIIDTGIGIAEQDKPNLFDKFTQADESITRKYGGTGLGMAIAKQLTESMNGKIDFSSIEGKGSTFWFELDFERQAILSEEKESLADFSGSRALIINPAKNKDNRIYNYLSLWKFIECDFAEHAQQAIEMINESNKLAHPYLVIIVFHNYLDTDSNHFIKWVRNNSSFNHHTFIMINEDEASAPLNYKYLTSGYSSVIDSKTDRTTLFRAIHSSVAGINTITIENSKEIEEKNYNYHSASGSLKILVGEDNLTNQKVIKNILEYGNHNITLANNGEEVLDMLENQNFDLIILDMQMPIMSGIEAAKIYRFSYPDKINIPILILTANATTEARNTCMEANIDAFLTKPVVPQKLLDTIESLTKNDSSSVSNNIENVIDFNSPDILPIIDNSVLDSIFSMAKERKFMEKLINDFINDAHLSIDKLEIAIKNNDHDQISSLFHTLDGSSSTIGAKKLSKICKVILKLNRSNNYAAIKNQFTEFKLIFTKTEKALYSYFENQNTHSKL